MAVQWAVSKCEYFLKGIPHFTVVTDHKPLLGIFDKHLHDLPNIRLQRFREHLVDYNFSTRWCPGKEHLIADALSRAPVFPAAPDTSSANLCSFSVEDTCDFISRDPIFIPIIADAKSDSEYQLLVQSLKSDLPFSPSLSSYNHIRHLLSLYTDRDDTCTLVIYDSSRLVIPTKSRRSILVSLHASHSGEVKSYTNARQLYYWPGMKNDITQFVRACQACQRLCLLYTSPSPRDKRQSRMPSSA